MREIKGYVDHIVFRNNENGYSVLNFISEEKEINVVGIFPDVSEGETLILQGEDTVHPLYEKQFSVKSYQVSAPEDELSMERYLSSGAIKGIGIALAARIVRHFKKDTFRIIEEEPERLAEIKGISQRMAMDISTQMLEKKELRDAMVYLAKYGIPTNLALRIYQQYGTKVYGILEENPYQLAEDMSGVGFRTADEIAKRMGIRNDSEYRIRSGLLYALSMGARSGHTCLPKEKLFQYASELLGVPLELLDNELMDLAIDKKIVMKDDKIYSKALYRMEESSAYMLRRLNQTYEVGEETLQQVIRQVEAEQEMELDDYQRKAVYEAVSQGVFILTGGPGTGKTTTIKTMISYFDAMELDFYLAAPTGRAAKRMSEATGYEAKTIHRLLEVRGRMEQENQEQLTAQGMFERNEENPIEADVIIVDEVSMMDITLLYSLLKAMEDGTRLILVGDMNQLPSVGPGNVLRDLIASKCFSTVTLQKIFRQSLESDIVCNAHAIQTGKEIVLDNKSKDFFFLKRYDGNQIISALLTLIQNKLPNYVHATPFEIQVITPTRKGVIGVERLNQILQEHLNPKGKDKEEYVHGERTFREGDKVMQIKNNYQLEWEIPGNYGIVIDHGLGVFNGDTGIIQEINSFSNYMKVKFDEGRIVTYNLKDLDELELSYAITIHKSQGSEYPAVVIPLLPGPKMLMNRNLIYTAITRGKHCVTLVGDHNTFYSMVNNTIEQERFSGLQTRLQAQFQSSQL